MTDNTTNTTDTAAGTTTAQAPAPDFLQKVEADLAEFGEETIAKIEAAVSTFETKYAPYIKTFLVTLLQQEGKDALDAAIASAPSGNPSVIAASVGAALAGTLAANAEADAKAGIQQEETDAANAAAGTATGSAAQ
jgi:hypothetical protein